MQARASGILLPVFSLPGPYGIGTLGKPARQFIDFLAAGGQKFWQILPLVPPGGGNSPYMSPSSFAGNPLFLDLDELAEEELLTQDELRSACRDNPDRVDYAWLHETRLPLLRKAFERGRAKYAAQLKEFEEQEGDWLPDYALFLALREHFGGKELADWPDEVRLRQPKAMEQYRVELAEACAFQVFLQYLFFRQWKAVKTYANSKGVSIIGDLPIYVSPDSAEVWGNPELFQLKKDMRPSGVAGVPPDAFSDKGQHWGNPLYDWDYHKKTDFAWWKRRMEASAKLYDVLRIDHFIGVVQYYSIPYGVETAKEGRWEKGPGKKLTDALDASAGKTRIIAEDLGIYVPEVKELLAKTGYPGMKIIEFAFSGDRFNEHLPHCYEPNSVVYGGTHDNETLAGYFTVEKRQWWELQYIADYLGAAHQSEVVDRVFRAAYGSVASVAIFQMQDVLKLDNRARMNTPGTVGGNWRWRMRQGQFDRERIEYLAWLVDIFGRF